MNKTQPKTPDLADDSATQTDSKQRKPSKNRTKAEQILTQTKRNNEPRSYKLDSVTLTKIELGISVQKKQLKPKQTLLKKKLTQWTKRTTQ